MSYLSVSADLYVLVELDGLFRMLSECVCSVCLSVCVFLARLCKFVRASRNMSALGLGLCVCVSVHIEMCKNVSVCVAGYGVTGRSSSPQTRPDDEEGKQLAECSGVLCSGLQSGTWPWAATK